MLNISKQICAGWDNTVVFAELPEVEIIPLGNSAQEKKKLEKFTEKHAWTQDYDNVPLPGFTLHDTNKKYYSAESHWLVIDPRGFLVKISQSNMVDILKITGITEGLIQERCVWARENSSTAMILVPVSSATYTDAVGNTELIETKVDIKDVNIGDTVLLQNKLTGTYLGVMSLYCSMQNSYSTHFKVQSMLRRQVIEITPGKFHYQTDAKILKVLTPATKILTKEEAVSHVNNTIRVNSNTYFTPTNRMSSNYYGSSGTVKLASLHAAPKVSINMIEIDYATATTMLNTARFTTDPGCIVVESVPGKKFIIDFPWITVTSKANEFRVQEITSVNADNFVLVDVPVYNRNTLFTLDNFTKYYKIVKSVKADTYI